MNFLAWTLLVAAVLAGPPVSVLWLGRIDSSFLICLTVVSAGWLTNVLSAPAYFACLALGDLKPNFMMHLWHGAITVLGGLLLGKWLGGLGAVAAASAGLIVGSLIMVSATHTRLALAPPFLPKGTMLLAGSAILSAALSLAAAISPPSALGRVIGALGIAFLGIGSLILAVRQYGGLAVLRDGFSIQAM